MYEFGIEPTKADKIETAIIVSEKVGNELGGVT